MLVSPGFFFLALGLVLRHNFRLCLTQALRVCFGSAFGCARHSFRLCLVQALCKAQRPLCLTQDFLVSDTAVSGTGVCFGTVLRLKPQGKPIFKNLVFRGFLRGIW